MIAVRALDDGAYAAGREGGGGGLKLRHHRAGREAVALGVGLETGIAAVPLHHFVEKRLPLGLRHGQELVEGVLRQGFLRLLLALGEAFAVFVHGAEEDVLHGHEAVALRGLKRLLVGELRALLAVEDDEHARVERHGARHEVVELGRYINGVQVFVQVLERAVLAYLLLYVAPLGLGNYLLVLGGELYAIFLLQLGEDVVLHAVARGVHGEVFAHRRLAVYALVEGAAGEVAVIVRVEPVEELVPAHLVAVHGEHDRVVAVGFAQGVPVVFGGRALRRGGGGDAGQGLQGRLRAGLAAAREGGEQQGGAEAGYQELFHHFSPSLSKTFPVSAQSAMKAAASSRTRAPGPRRRARTGFFAASTLSRPFQRLWA